MRRLVPLSIVSVAIVSLAGCGGDSPGDAERFCGEIQANAEAIVAVPETTGDVDNMLDLYQDIGEAAPIAIEEDWDALVRNLETANTVEPGDPESQQRAVLSAYSTERSAVAVHDWLLTNCGVDLGPVATVGPPAPPPPPTTAAG